MALKEAGQIQEDLRQEAAMTKLEELYKRVIHYTPSASTVRSVAAPAASASTTASSGFLGGFFGGGSTSKAPAAKKEPPRLKPVGPIGLYMWGGTGTGKTFMMDLFHSAVPGDRKKRVHFNEWMIDVNERLHRLQKASKNNASAGTADDLVAQVAGEMISEAWLLCFDEFQVTHISDAIIMKRVFEVLFRRGCVVVATSNRPPEDLYLNGLNRSLFLPFIPMLKDFCEVYAIGAEVDYRLIGHHDEEDDRVYITPNGPEERKMLERKFFRICQGKVRTSLNLETQGRRFLVPRAAEKSDVAWFSFSDLCDKPLGAADYLAVATAFHTLFITDIPRLTLQERDQVRRFITLIDALYEKQTKLVCVADTDPINLFYVSEEDRKTSVHDEVFAWDRTVSRLTEMQSIKYLSEQQRALDADQFLGQFKVTALGDDDLTAIWRRYDQDDSGSLDRDEVRLLLEDILEADQGHRNLSNEAFDACMAVIDRNDDGDISRMELDEFLKDFSLVRTTVHVQWSSLA